MERWDQRELHRWRLLDVIIFHQNALSEFEAAVTKRHYADETLRLGEGGLCRM